MPIYDFRCRACGQEAEHLLRKDAPLPRCPACESSDLERLTSIPSVVSSQTRRAAKRSLRGRNREIRRDAAHEEHKRLHEHSD